MQIIVDANHCECKSFWMQIIVDANNCGCKSLGMQIFFHDDDDCFDDCGSDDADDVVAQSILWFLLKNTNYCQSLNVFG